MQRDFNQLNRNNSRCTSRGWVYTIFNIPDLRNGSGPVTPEDFDRWFASFEAYLDRIKYVIGQVERCPQSGRLHLQLYVEFNSPVRVGELQRIRGLQPGYGWAEPRRGTPQEAAAYCCKEESRVLGPFELGRIPPGAFSLDESVYLVYSLPVYAC